MKKEFNIVMIGTGNVSTQLTQQLNLLSSCRVVQAYNHQNTKSTKQFALINKVDVVTHFDAINTNADLYIIAVKDEAIAEVAKSLKKIHLKGIVVHTSGSINLSVLKSVTKNIGVFYPLQTFYPGANINWEETPILVEGNSVLVQNKLKSVAKLLSNQVQTCNSEKRLIIHLSAVFACNFTNALYATAFELINSGTYKQTLALLYPIIKQSVEKFKTISPVLAQTGPAKRKDDVVIHKHLQLLKNKKQLQTVYKNITQLIITQQTI